MKIHALCLKIIAATAMVILGCGDNGDSTNNVPNNTQSITIDEKDVSSSSEINEYGCRAGELIKDKNGTVISFCSNGEWNIVPQSTQIEELTKCLDGEIMSNQGAKYICSNEQWIPVVSTDQVELSSSSFGLSNILSSTSQDMPTIIDPLSMVYSSSIADFSFVVSSSSFGNQVMVSSSSLNHEEKSSSSKVVISSSSEVYTSCDKPLWQLLSNWEEFSDVADGGESVIQYKSGRGEYYFELDVGTLTYNPFVGIEFKISSKLDVSEYSEVCIAYAADEDATLEIEFGDELYRDALPFVDLPKSSSIITKAFEWSRFEQPRWAHYSISGSEAARKMKALNFKIQGKSGLQGNINIMSVGLR